MPGIEYIGCFEEKLCKTSMWNSLTEKQSCTSVQRHSDSCKHNYRSA